MALGFEENVQTRKYNAVVYDTSTTIACSI